MRIKEVDMITKKTPRNKGTIAKLLATEDIFVVYKQMETAYFDSKKRELGLPIWNDEDMTADISDLMTCHEIGHALWTPLDMLERAAIRKINHSFVNVIEDARIEKFVKVKYPGTAGVFTRGYVDLVSRDFFGTAGKDISKLNLIDRINLYFKSADTTIPFSAEENVWVDRIRELRTEDEVLDLAEELYKWMEENPSSDEEPATSGDSGDSGETGEGTEGSGSGPNGNEEGKEENGNSNGGNSSGDAGDDKSAGSEDDADDGEEDGASGADTNDKVENEVDEKGDGTKEDSPAEGGVETSGKGSHSLPEATTDTASKKGMDAFRDKVAADRQYAKVPKVDLEKIIISPKTCVDEMFGYFMEQKSKDGCSLFFDTTVKELDDLKADSKKTVAYMVKEFEMKKSADAYARAATAKTGSLDMGKLHTYKYNEDLFKKVTTLPGATNHGMLLVLDWSGSMADNLKGTLSQLFNLVWFCRQSRIPFEVFAFSDMYSSTRRYDYDTRKNMEMENFKAGDLAMHNFNMLNFFSSNMSISDEMKMMQSLLMYANKYAGFRDWNALGYPYNADHRYELGGTPLNDAIVAMMDIAPKFKNDTGVQRVNTIFLTDGDSNRLAGVYDYRLNTNKESPDFGTHSDVIEPIQGGWNSYKSREIMLTDPVTNKTFQMKGSATHVLLKALKNRVPDMNVLGFFIAGSGRSGRVDKRVLAQFVDPYKDVMESVKQINKDKFLAVTCAGFDEYYILPGGTALQVENGGLSDDLEGATKAKLKSAFGKAMKSKIASRQLLNKFVKLVA